MPRVIQMEGHTRPYRFEVGGVIQTRAAEEPGLSVVALTFPPESSIDISEDNYAAWRLVVIAGSGWMQTADGTRHELQLGWAALVEARTRATVGTNVGMTMVSITHDHDW